MLKFDVEIKQKADMYSFFHRLRETLQSLVYVQKH